MKSRINAQGIRAVGIGSVVLLLAALHGTTAGAQEPGKAPAAAEKPAAPAGSAAMIVKLATSDEVGAFLSAPGQLALYVHARDYKGTSECRGQCAEKWPPFYLERVIPGARVPQLFGTIARDDGKPQTTFRGWPLYLFAGDERGKVAGDGVKDVWFVAQVPFYTVMTAVADKLGTFLVGPSARALYVADGETTAASTCGGDCLKQWRPFYMDRLILPKSLPQGDFETFVRPDGERQIAYKGRPLYWFKADANMGDASGAATKGWSLATVSR